MKGSKFKSGIHLLLSREGNIHHCFPLNGNVRQPNCQVDSISSISIVKLTDRFYFQISQMHHNQIKLSGCGGSAAQLQGEVGHSGDG